MTTARLILARLTHLGTVRLRPWRQAVLRLSPMGQGTARLRPWRQDVGRRSTEADSPQVKSHDADPCKADSHEADTL